MTPYTGNVSPIQNSASVFCVSGRYYKMASLLCLRSGPTNGRCWLALAVTERRIYLVLFQFFIALIYSITQDKSAPFPPAMPFWAS